MKKNLPILTWILSFVLWTSCGSGTSSSSSETSEDQVKDTIVTAGEQPPLFDSTTIKSKIVPDKKKMPYKGKFLQALSWVDKSGTNTLIFSTKEAYLINSEEELRRTDFWACCYLESKGVQELQWEIADQVDSCWCDCQVELRDETIRIKDLDGDGIAENLFIYVLNGRCDASPVETKLMMHSGRAKMAIRGYSEQYLGPSEAETNRFRKEIGLKPINYKDVDKGFDPQPAIYREYASAFWDSYIKKENETFRQR